jgi:hypothetical protein
MMWSRLDSLLCAPESHAGVPCWRCDGSTFALRKTASREVGAKVSKLGRVVLRSSIGVGGDGRPVGLHWLAGCGRPVIAGGGLECVGIAAPAASDHCLIVQRGMTIWDAPSMHGRRRLTLPLGC